MEALHARYPFLSAARDAVGEAGVDLVDLVGSDDPAVERGRERVERALVEGTIVPGPDSRPDTRTELLSYPIARVLVSLLDTPGAVEKYAAAEADTAYERFTEAFESRDRRATTTGTAAPEDRVSVETFLREFELGDDVHRRAAEPTTRATGTTATTATTGAPAAGTAAGATGSDGPGYAVAVGTYLRYAPDDPDWKLVRRELADGWVHVSRSDLYELLREAVERRVAAGLPLEVPDAIAVPLADRVSDLRATLASVDYPRTIETVDPAAFPPCIDDLVSRARADDALGPFERFALVTFLAYLDMTAEDVRDFCGRHGDSFRYATERLAGDGGSYPPPSFVTLRDQGVCDCAADAHDGADHPLTYYVERIEPTDADAGADGAATDGAAADEAEADGAAADGVAEVDDGAEVDAAEDAGPTGDAGPASGASDDRP